MKCTPGSWCALATLMLSLVLLSGCSALPPGADFPKTASAALVRPAETRLGRQFADAGRLHPDMSGFRLVPVGADGFLIRMQMINAAERTLDLQYFIFRGDDTGRLITDAVLRAADRGVRVRVLIDDGETSAGDEQIHLLEFHPAIEIRIFNPFAYRGGVTALRAIEFMFNAARLDYRMHNKLMVVDNAVALLGGRNIGDKYFQIAPESQFADDDLFAAGPIAPQLSATFDEYWNSALSIPVAALGGARASSEDLREHRARLTHERKQAGAEHVDYLARVALGEPFAGVVDGRLPLIWAHAELICDSPEKKNVASGAVAGRLMQVALSRTVQRVQSELLMVTPYLIPGSEGMKLLLELRRRQVAVRILTNSLESSSILLAHAGYMHYRLPLLEQGVEIYEIRSLLGNAKGSGQTMAISRFGNYSLHAKMYVFDRQRIFLGSMNFDQRSMHLNTEIGLIIDSPELARQLAARFEAMAHPLNAYQVRLQADAAGERPQLRWHTQEAGRVLDYDTEPARSAWQRFKAHALTLLSVDGEL